MKAYDVIMQLNKVLPTLTDRFTDSVAVDSITSVGTLATVVCSAPHGQVNDNFVTISGFANPTLIDTMNRSGTIVTVVTQTDHDLTEGWQENITIQGANESEFNGTFKLLTVPNRRTFTYETSDAGPTVATGSPQLNETTGFGYNGYYQITVLNDTTFTYELGKDLGSPAINVSGKVEIGYRITGALDLQSCVDIYTEKQLDKSWAFVVIGDTTASKDRKIQNDATYVNKGNSQYLQELIEKFSVYVVTTCSDFVTARPVRDDMEDVSVHLFKSLLGAKLPTLIGPNIYYSVVFDTHDMVLYNKGIYVHEFRFETMATITCTDVFQDVKNVAFRNIETIQSVPFMTELTERMTDNINLDEEPLP